MILPPVMDAEAGILPYVLVCVNVCPPTELAAVRVTRCAVTLFADGVYPCSNVYRGRVRSGAVCWDSYTDRLNDAHTDARYRRGTSPVVATVQGQPIAAEDLTNALRGELMRLEIQRYQTLRDKLDELIADKIFSLEAAQRGVSVQQFVHDEISAKIQAVATSSRCRRSMRRIKAASSSRLRRSPSRSPSYLNSRHRISAARHYSRNSAAALPCDRGLTVLLR